MNTILVAGYKSFDVGVFSNKDPRLLIIKKAISLLLQIDDEDLFQ